MRGINLKHLHYFWAVAHQASIAAASEHLFVTPQTISAQLKELEGSLGCKLLRRNGKTLTLTAAGETALEYADGIFELRRGIGYGAGVRARCNQANSLVHHPFCNLA